MLVWSLLFVMNALESLLQVTHGDMRSHEMSTRNCLSRCDAITHHWLIGYCRIVACQTRIGSGSDSFVKGPVLLFPSGKQKKRVEPLQALLSFLAMATELWDDNYLGNRRFDMEEGKIFFTILRIFLRFCRFHWICSLSWCRCRSLGFYRDGVLLDMGDCVEFYAK